MFFIHVHLCKIVIKRLKKDYQIGLQSKLLIFAKLYKLKLKIYYKLNSSDNSVRLSF